MRRIPFDLRRHAWSRIAVSLEKKIIYIRIPKAANSTIVKTLAVHIFPQSKEQFIADDTGALSKKSFGSLLSTKRLSQENLLKTYYVFSFFRDPYTRILSTYLDKLQSDFSYRKFQWVADVMKVKSTKDMTFSDFISFLEGGRLHKNAHWAPQVKLCPFPVERLDFAGKIENLESDLTVVMERLFGPNHFKGIVKRQHNRQHAVKKMDLFYTEDLMRRVYFLYQEDFKILGYPRDISV